MQQPCCTVELWVYKHLYTHMHIPSHFALKPRSEHSFTVLMRQRIKQQTEGPLCSPSPPQREPALGVERRHEEGDGWMEEGHRWKRLIKISSVFCEIANMSLVQQLCNGDKFQRSRGWFEFAGGIAVLHLHDSRLYADTGQFAMFIVTVFNLFLVTHRLNECPAIPPPDWTF